MHGHTIAKLNELGWLAHEMQGSPALLLSAMPKVQTRVECRARLTYYYVVRP